MICSLIFAKSLPFLILFLKNKVFEYLWLDLSSLSTKQQEPCTKYTHPAEMLSTAIQFSQTQLLYKKDAFGYKKFNSKLKCKLRKFFVYMVSCLFTKHLLTYCSLTIDDTEKLCQPNRRASIGGHSIGSTFICTSTVCLPIVQDVNVSRINFFSVKLTYILVNKSTNKQNFE